MLTGRDLHHRYGKASVLAGVDLTLAPGEVLGLDGPSGGGKSTLARILAGHIRPTAGQVLADGAPLVLRSGVPLPVQYAPQASELSVDPRWRVGRILRNGAAPAAATLEALGIRPDWTGRFAGELSGGELARVSLARVLLPSTRYLICDEVTAPLDAIAAADLAQTLRDIARGGIGVLLISHNAGLLARHADRVLHLRGGVLWETPAPAERAQSQRA